MQEVNADSISDPKRSESPQDALHSPASGQATGPIDPRIDPVTGLHKMSTTAGVGSQEYVAINVTAVVAVLLGLASFLSLINNVLLVIPAVGIICACVAIRQVGRSNGTQTGRGLAFLGLILSILVAGSILLQQGSDYARTRPDRQAIAGLCVQFGQDCKDGNLEHAYGLFSQRFQAKMPKDRFVVGMRRMQLQILGPISSGRWNGHIAFQSDPDSGTKTAVAMIVFTYEKSGPDNQDRQAITFRNAGDQWKIDGIPSLFPDAVMTAPK